MTTGPTFQVIGVRPDGSRELCGARLSRQAAESMVSTLRTMTARGYVDVLLEQEPDDPGPYGKSWSLKFPGNE